MPVNPAPADTPLSRLPNFDPRAIAVASIDAHLPALARDAIAPDALRARFAHPPLWQPEISTERKFSQRPLAHASVLMPIVTRDRPTVILTERTTHLSTHSGQVAFPGGKRDDSDTDAAHTALREAHEEIGLEHRFVDVIGQMPTYTRARSSSSRRWLRWCARTTCSSSMRMKSPMRSRYRWNS